MRIELDGQTWTAFIHDGRLDIQVGEIAKSDGSIRTDPKTFRDLIGAPSRLRNAIHIGTAGVDGDQTVIRRMLKEVVPPDQMTVINVSLMDATAGV